jgi:hypothetical protein
MADWLSSTWLQIISVSLAAVMAYYKGRRIVLWGFLGYFFGPLALVILAFRRTLPRKEYAILNNAMQRAASRGIEKEFEGLGTPDDFLREINKDQGGKDLDGKDESK